MQKGRVLNKVGDWELVKGRGDKIDLVVWDAVGPCDVDICPCASSCVYASSAPEKCTVQVTYLQHVLDMVLATFPAVSDKDMFMVGMHIIPLYKVLCRLLMVESGLDRYTYTSNAGTPGIHPVLREIRNTITAIRGEWRELDIASSPPHPSLPNALSGMGYYEAMEKGALKMKSAKPSKKSSVNRYGRKKLGKRKREELDSVDKKRERESAKWRGKKPERGKIAAAPGRSS